MSPGWGIYVFCGTIAGFCNTTQNMTQSHMGHGVNPVPDDPHIVYNHRDDLGHLSGGKFSEATPMLHEEKLAEKTEIITPEKITPQNMVVLQKRGWSYIIV